MAYMTENQAEMQRKRGRPAKRIEAERATPPKPAVNPEKAPEAVVNPAPAPEPVKAESARDIWVRVKYNYNPAPGTVYINDDGNKAKFPAFEPEDAAERHRCRLKPGTLALLPVRDARELLNAGYAEMWVPEFE